MKTGWRHKSISLPLVLKLTIKPCVVHPALVYLVLETRKRWSYCPGQLTPSEASVMSMLFPRAPLEGLLLSSLQLCAAFEGGKVFSAEEWFFPSINFMFWNSQHFSVIIFSTWFHYSMSFSVSACLPVCLSFVLSFILLIIYILPCLDISS